jgi:hypothetical protein
MSLKDLLRKNIVLDSCAGKDKEKEVDKKPTFDGADSEKYVMQDMKIKAANAISSWCETDDLKDDEDSAARLQALFIGIVDVNKDGEITDDEQNYLEALLNYAWDYLSIRGIDDDDIDLLLNEWDAGAADRIMDLLNGSAPDGDDDIDSFAFGTNDQEVVFDGVFKNVVSFLHGVKTKIHKRISGMVRLSGAQKSAVRKMHMRSHSAGAMLKRAKSMRARKRSGL